MACVVGAVGGRVRGGCRTEQGGRDAAHCLYAGVLWGAGLRFVGAGAWLMGGEQRRDERYGGSASLWSVEGKG